MRDTIHLRRRGQGSVEVVPASKGGPVRGIVGEGAVRDERVSEPDGGRGRHVERLRQAGHGGVVRSVGAAEVEGEDVM